MNLRITLEIGEEHLNYAFSEEQAPIRVGRDDACDVRIAEELRTVGRMHCELQWIAGQWRLCVNQKNPVFLNGRRVRIDEAIGDSASVTLGSTDGPELVVKADQSTGLLSTFVHATHTGLATLLARVQRQNRALSLLLALTVVTFATLLAWVYVARPPDLKAVLATTMASTYQVVEKGAVGGDKLRGESPRGTAWVVAPGILATNAHVAEIFGTLRPGHELYVRAAAPSTKEHRVSAVQTHPAFGPFFATWSAYAPHVRNQRGALVPFRSIGGYDAGLLFVDDEDTLAPPLPIASQETLYALAPGDEVAYAGFPVGGHRPVNNHEPVHTTHRGTISALTDFFFRPKAERQLIQHSLAASHGASGSPIVNRRGEVVAVLSGGNVVLIPDPTGGRVFVPTGPGIYFAHRADLIREVLVGGVDLSTLHATWRSALCEFESSQPVPCPPLER